ncbi:MAG: hypothetical protein ABGY95_00295 [Rubritalea sp.]|uniref:hypothetical protein n=1 Tax=Rubritalea sp. TaxID=2109375 RepID=UPI00324229D1
MTQKSKTPLTVTQAAKKIKEVCMEDPLGEFIWQHLEPSIDKLNDENLSLKQQWEHIYSAYECLAQIYEPLTPGYYRVMGHDLSTLSSFSMYFVVAAQNPNSPRSENAEAAHLIDSNISNFRRQRVTDDMKNSEDVLATFNHWLRDLSKTIALTVRHFAKRENPEKLNHHNRLGRR